jgi:pimeloyl-ACP methyl ester carboxylesterase
MNTSQGKTAAKSPGRWSTVTLVTWGAVFSVLVGADGSLGWRLVRVGVVIAAAAVAVWLSVRTRRLGALVTVACGTIGLAVGIVFGLRFLTVDGLSWRAVAGLIMLIVGLVLVATGVRRLVSGLARGWGFVAGTALVFVVLLAVWTLTPALLATNVPPIPVEEATPDDFGLTAREVRFVADDGVELFAWHVPSDNGAAVVLRHGSGSTASSVLAQAEVLARHGFGVLLTDARGHARSGGRAMDFGWYGDTDIAAAVSFLAAQPDVDPERIAVVGLSMGGEEALGAAAEDSRIAAVVAEGATGRTDADKAWFADMYGTRGRIQLGLEWVQFSLTDLLTDASKPIALADAARAAAPRPVLLIAAGRIADEGHAAAYIQRQAQQSVTIWVGPEAGHTQGLSVAPAGWERAVISFLDAALVR